METINNLFDQEITKTVDAYPSIFSKDDVINLLSSLRTQVLTEVSELKPTGGITEAQFQEFSADVVRQLDRALSDGIIEVYNDSSAEFTISYDNRVELEHIDIITDNITDELDAILLDQFKAHFEKLLTDNPE